MNGSLGNGDSVKKKKRKEVTIKQVAFFWFLLFFVLLSHELLSNTVSGLKN